MNLLMKAIGWTIILIVSAWDIVYRFGERCVAKAMGEDDDNSIRKVV